MFIFLSDIFMYKIHGIEMIKRSFLSSCPTTIKLCPVELGSSSDIQRCNPGSNTSVVFMCNDLHFFVFILVSTGSVYFVYFIVDCLKI